MEEVWKDIQGYEGKYTVSNYGNVKWANSSKIRKGSVNKHNGYVYVFLRDKQYKSKNVRLHRLVAQTFIPNPENKPEVNHKDCNKQNNCVNNLEWSTRQENIDHSWKNGRCQSAIERIMKVNETQFGERHHQSKLTEKEVLEIRKIGTTKSLREIGLMYNVSLQLIWYILKRKNWKHI